MQFNLVFFARFYVFTAFIFFASAIVTSAQFVSSFTNADSAIMTTRPKVNDFANPLVTTAGASCSTENLRNEKFVSETPLVERIRVCLALDKITAKLNQTVWSPALSTELKFIWQTFSVQQVTLRSMQNKFPSQILAMAEPFPEKTRGDIFTAAVYIRLENSDDASFFQILLHELRHVHDFYETWKNKTALSSIEIERRAYLLMGKLTRETAEKERFSGVPKFWKESWRNLSESEISEKREAAIQKFLRGKKLYRELAMNPSRQTLDFSYLKTNSLTNDLTVTDKYNKKEGERMPFHQAIPPTVTVLPQKIQESGFNLEKPKNPRDPKEILRVALSNEKKLYYGMSNFVYDQKLAFQCLKEGKISGSFTENHTVARTGNGNALFNLTDAPTALPCILNIENLKTDFTNTFWASPALEKMPIYFMGFFEVEGKMLAHYSVLQPDAKLFSQLANEYPQIRPFRVIVGTIYVSPEDGQIVRFAGTSFPEESVTGEYARKVHCTYWVKAVRQKLNIENGLWVTVHVGSVAMANIKGKIQPFNYTVKFENYRQSETDVKIVDEETVALAR